MVVVPLPPKIRALPEPHPVELLALDGEPLAGCHFAPRRAARGAALIVPAMGVPQAFYAPLATWLAEIGVHALTFDYRGTGRSSRRPLREVEADVVTWARLDTGAALRALQDRVPGAPLTWLGHSLGAQIIPFVPDHRELAQVITIAAGTGYWRDNVAAVRLKAWLMWHVATPLLTPLFGYFPGKRLHMVGDLPAGVTRQWRRWCLDPQYTVGAEGPLVRELYARVTAPITSLSFTDDEIMSERNTESLHAFYVAAPTTMRRIAPQAVGMPRIGHFDFFRPASREPLWEAVLRPELALR